MTFAAKGLIEEECKASEKMKNSEKVSI